MLAVLLTDVKRNSETKKQFIMRLEDFLLTRSNSLTKVVITKSRNNRLAIAILYSSNQHSQLVNSVFDELKINESADTPIFKVACQNPFGQMQNVKTLI